MPRILFITGTDTEVGKTHITCQLASCLREMGIKTGIYKPVCSGAEHSPDGTPVWNDVEQHFFALNGKHSRELICPQRFLLAAAPPIAAERESRSVNRDQLLQGAIDWFDRCEILLIEGAGGWQSPIAEKFTNAGLAKELHADVAVVSANRLGMINHTILTCESIFNHGLRLSGVIVNQISAIHDESTDSNLKTLQNYLTAKCYGPVEFDNTQDTQRTESIKVTAPISQFAYDFVRNERFSHSSVL